ncbi:MAG: hypothetical protein NWE98_10170 [Candidatus Bathyarchaeota archaeon]|nr:hypothetical protein [Candidatus Bathyarchaeota archaeon]
MDCENMTHKVFKFKGKHAIAQANSLNGSKILTYVNEKYDAKNKPIKCEECGKAIREEKGFCYHNELFSLSEPDGAVCNAVWLFCSNKCLRKFVFAGKVRQFVCDVSNAHYERNKHRKKKTKKEQA